MDMRWHTLLLALAAYMALSWLLLNAAGEEALTANVDFFYWIMVTTSTVGYGDLSPVTPAGKLIVSFIVIPLGLSLFALAVGQIATWVIEFWRRGVKGLKDLDLTNHILVIGWNEQHTMRLLQLLIHERKSSNHVDDIVLCVRADIENPLPGKIKFVKVSSFNNDEDMDRASVSSARTIIMDNPEDDLTMTTALYCANRNKDGHLIAYFQDESLTQLLKQHCPNIECTPSVAVEMLAKSAVDPGSSELHYDLLEGPYGQAQYAVELPQGLPAIKIATLFNGLKQQYKATLIGVSSNNQPIELNPDLDAEVKAGDRLFYIADKRLTDINWSTI